MTSALKILEAKRSALEMASMVVMEAEVTAEAREDAADPLLSWL